MSAVRIRQGKGFLSWKVFPSEIAAEQAPKLDNATSEVILRSDQVKLMAKACKQQETSR